MKTSKGSQYDILRLHLTNVTGSGATKLLMSLLPSLERHSSVQISEIHLPDKGILSNYLITLEKY